MLSVSSFMLAFSVSSIFAFNLNSFITILSHLSHVFISTLTCSSCLPMYPEHLSHVFIYTLTYSSHVFISTLTHSRHVHICSDTLKSCFSILHDTFKSCLQSSSLPGHTQVTSSYLP